MEIGKKILRYRAKHRISQREFANLCGLSVMTVNYIENGLQDPSKITLEKIKIVLEEDDEAVDQQD